MKRKVETIEDEFKDMNISNKNKMEDIEKEFEKTRISKKTKMEEFEGNSEYDELYAAFFIKKESPHLIKFLEKAKDRYNRYLTFIFNKNPQKIEEHLKPTYNRIKIFLSMSISDNNLDYLYNLMKKIDEKLINILIK